MEDEPGHSEVNSSSQSVHWRVTAPLSPASGNATVREPEGSQCSVSPQPQRRVPRKADDEATGPGPAAVGRSQLARLRASNDALRRNITALKMLATEADRLTAILSMMPRTVPRAPMPSPVSNPAAVAAQLLELAFSENYENDLSLENKYVSLPTEIMVALEAAFRQRLAELVRRWTVEMKTRPAVERRLASAMRSRINGTRALSLNRPDTQAKLMSAMMPQPGTPAATAARARLKGLAADLGVDACQQERMSAALVEYRGTVDSMKEALETAQLTAAVCLTAGENAKHAAFRMMSLHLVAHNSVALTHSAGVYQQLQHRSLFAYLRLAAAVFGSLSAVQGAKLLLGSLPYLPDHAELCVIVCGEQ